MQKTNTRSENVTTVVSHPDFLRWMEDWKTLNDVVDGGESTVKAKGQRYLPATSGQVSAWNLAMPGVTREIINTWQYVDSSDSPIGCTGQGAYSYYLYKFRSIFFEYPSATVRQMVGRLTSIPPSEMKLPAGLDPLIDKATDDGKSLEDLIEVIFGEQCKYSRCGVLADFPEGESTLPPYLTTYGALRVLNWSTDRNADGTERLKWVLLDESKYVQDGINWQYKIIIRVCAIDEESGNYFTKTHDITEIIDKPDDVARLNMLEADEDTIFPKFKGKESKVIPFVFINATNTESTPELPILNNVASLSLALYRGEADYRQALFVQGQATPAFTGCSPEEAKKFLLGANGGVASQNKDFRAEYMEVSGDGLSEMRESQANLHALAAKEGTKLTEGGVNESGEALKVRSKAQTVDLIQIASSCEQGLTQIFKIIAEWGGLSGEVEIELNKEFSDSSITPADLVQMMSAYTMGAPMTKEDVHKWANKGGLIESDWEEVKNDLDMSGRNDDSNTPNQKE